MEGAIKPIDRCGLGSGAIVDSLARNPHSYIFTGYHWPDQNECELPKRV